MNQRTSNEGYRPYYRLRGPATLAAAILLAAGCGEGNRNNQDSPRGDRAEQPAGQDTGPELSEEFLREQDILDACIKRLQEKGSSATLGDSLECDEELREEKDLEFTPEELADLVED